MAVPRPDPDTLLRHLNDEATRAARGRLRIYFGASAGVGKTWAMLDAARQRRSDGVDVVVGVVETHGRVETAAQLQDLAVLPPAQIESGGRTLPEFDLDGALARHPMLILVDEFAPQQRGRFTATPNAGKTSKNCSTTASTSTPRSTCSISRA